MSAIGQVLGPLFGGVLDQGTGWRAVFIANVPLLAFSALLTLATMAPGRRPAVTAGIDVAGGLALLPGKTTGRPGITGPAHI
jgi:MFS family permease